MTGSPHDSATAPSATRWIILAVLIWGLLLALGTYLFGGNQPLLRAAIVAGCTFGFLGLWLAALAVRQRRLRNN
jgi:high-affinity Fe2+/Pb2+ permease